MALARKCGLLALAVERGFRPLQRPETPAVCRLSRHATHPVRKLGSGAC
jgi:hypothetical protein